MKFFLIFLLSAIALASAATVDEPETGSDTEVEAAVEESDTEVAENSTVVLKRAQRCGGTCNNMILGAACLSIGQTLTACQIVGCHIMVLQPDGNLVIYTSKNVVVWQTFTAGSGATKACLQSDGNFVLYNSANQAKWATNSKATAGVNAILNNDGTFQIIGDGVTKWTSGATASCLAACGDTIAAGDCLSPGQIVSSCSSCFNLVFQTDGNFVIYNSVGVPIWHTNTANTGAVTACMQADGNFVLASATTSVWNTGTAGKSGAVARIMNDGTFVLLQFTKTVYSNGAASTCPLSGDVIATGACLTPGQSRSSGNGGCFQVTFQTDGNLVVTNRLSAIIWQSNTANRNATQVCMQANGNLVINTATATIWASNTNYAGDFAQIQDTGVFAVVSASGGILDWKSGAATTCPPTDVVTSGTCLSPGQERSCGNGGCFKLAFQTDGNLVVKNALSYILWTSGTANRGATSACMQTDGNFVIYAGGTPIWHTNTSNNPGAFAQILDTAVFAVVSATGGVLKWNNGVATVCPLRGDVIASGVCLTPGQERFTVSTNSGSSCFKVTFQPDGNFVVRNRLSATIWATWTYSQGATTACMQNDGNFVIYAGTNPIWSTNTAGNPGAFGQILGDGRFAVVSAAGGYLKYTSGTTAACS